MMTEPRAGARLFQGAKVSLGEVTKLGRPLLEMTPNEVAYIVTRYMREHAEQGVFYSGVPHVLNQLWPYETATVELMHAVRVAMRRNGWRALREGSRFLGWQVPNEDTWEDQPDRRPKSEGGGQVPEVSEVKTSWRCPVCGNTFTTRFNRDRHSQRVHGFDPVKDPQEQPVAEPVSEVPKLFTCQQCGETFTTARGLGGHRRKHTMVTPQQRRLLAAIKEYPGLRPKEYAVLLDWHLAKDTQIYSVAYALIREKRLRVEGHMGTYRWFPRRRGPIRHQVEVPVDEIAAAVAHAQANGAAPTSSQMVPEKDLDLSARSDEPTPDFPLTPVSAEAADWVQVWVPRGLLAEVYQRIAERMAT